MKLGRFGPLTVDQARTEALRTLASVSRGADPLRERDEKRRDDAAAVTVRVFCDFYIERHAKPNKKTWKEDARRIRQYVLPAWGARRLDELTREDVWELYRQVGSGLRRPYEANRLLSQLSIMFNLAAEWGCLPETQANPAKIRKQYRYKEKRRERPVTSEELPRLMAAIEAEEDPHVRAAVVLELLTGLRKREILHRRWSDIDLGRRTLRLGDTKAGQPRQVPLSSAAAEIFATLPRRRGNPYVFPSPIVPGKPRHDINGPWRRIRRRADLPDLRFHDLRHSVATWLAEQGHPAQWIQKALGHQSIQTTMKYVHAADVGPRNALDQHGAQILDQLPSQ
jgi:integrase